MQLGRTRNRELGGGFLLKNTVTKKPEDVLEVREILIGSRQVIGYRSKAITRNIYQPP